MISVAICDDMEDQLKLTLDMIEEYIEEYSVDLQIWQFSHPDELLAALETEHFHLYILDIVMPMINGIQLGHKIRKMDQEAQIIYATTEPQFALESFSSYPLNYLVKPISKQQFFATIDIALSKVKEDVRKVMTVKTLGGLCILNYAEIICCEYRKHSVEYTTLKTGNITSVTMREPFLDVVAPLLDDSKFIQPHTSYVINMNMVEQMKKDAFFMKGGAVVPIVQKRYTQIRDLYFDYLLKKGGNIK